MENEIMSQTTLVLLKPDCMTKKVAGQVMTRFEEAGLEVIGCKMQQLSAEVLREHYAHIADKPTSRSTQKLKNSCVQRLLFLWHFAVKT